MNGSEGKVMEKSEGKVRANEGKLMEKLRASEGKFMKSEGKVKG